MRGKSLKVWNGGGDDKVHSNVVAPAPHGSSSCDTLSRESFDHGQEKDQNAKARDEGTDGRHIVPARERIGIIGGAARHTRKAKEVLGEKRRINPNKRDPEMQLTKRLVVHVAGEFREPVIPPCEDGEDGSK